ncbi:thiamine pyrophosphate-binding protein [Roseovarius sp. 2305UL8-3]|uniref:thiamine pyrophosphate-binding protein n=1 Tax=Roseovarius conchicola TaxID=3121636 RepID=UPI0035282ECE
MSTTVEVLADSLKEIGTDVVVGHPGGETVELMDALRERDMRYILMKQEVAAAMVAATWGELKGVPGMSTSTRGPGATNMVNGVAHAWLDRAPMIALTDQYPAHTYETGLRQVIDHQAIYKPITKWSTRMQAKTAHQQVRRAIRTAMAPTPGPVHIDMPATETTAEAPEITFAPSMLPNEQGIRPDRDALKVPLEMIRNARKPIILVGLGVFWDKASDEMVKLAETLGAPVLTTSKCKGAIPEDHALRAGCIIGGLIERELISQSDLVITLGVDCVELQPKSWPYGIPLLSIVNTPTLEALIPATLEVVGDIKLITQSLTEFSDGGSNWGEKAAAKFRDDLNNALNVATSYMSPQAAMEVARDVLPRDTIATCDAGASRLLVVQKWKSYAPRQFLTSNGLGSMGIAIPAALAARLAHPERPVVAFTGDGGFMMAVAELQTAAKENLPITVVIWDDREIALIRIKQELKGIEKFGIDLGGVDYEKLAAGFGADGVCVETEHQLGDALAAAAKSNRSTLIAARIDGSCYVEQFNALREL